MDECGYGEEKAEVKRWYDGFVFGKYTDIYNPWSILNFLSKGKYGAYWANTSSNRLVGKLIREGSHKTKQTFEQLLKGEHLRCPMDEQIVYNQLDYSESAIWSLLLASGYLKVLSYDSPELLPEGEKVCYELELTNYEVKLMFENMVSDWFQITEAAYQEFVSALLQGDLDAMNEYMNQITVEIFSSFDTGKRVSPKAQPERFYHGFVLGLLVDLRSRYVLTSNRESGFGRYDIMLEPRNPQKDVAIIIEFKVFNARREKTLEDTVKAALSQIEEKQYEAALIAKGIRPEHLLYLMQDAISTGSEKYPKECTAPEPAVGSEYNSGLGQRRLSRNVGAVAAAGVQCVVKCPSSTDNRVGFSDWVRD